MLGQASEGLAVSSSSEIAAVLGSARFRYTSEDELQQGISLVLDKHGFAFEREARLDARSRIDFLVGDVGIEVKVAGSAADLGVQVLRYLRHDRIRAVVIVTTRARHRDIPAELEGKPVHIVHLLASAF